MPKALEDKLRKTANGLARKGKLKRKTGDSLSTAVDRYVYGTMRKTGWKPSREKK
jgi:hypothetical protein